MIWIIENLTKEQSFLDLERAVTAAGIETRLIKGDFYKKSLEGIKDQRVMLNASIEMNKLIGDQLRDQGCWPVSYCSWEKYLCSNYYQYFPSSLFNYDGILTPLSELNRQKWWFWKTFGIDGLIFMRPDDGDKPFKAGLWDIDEWAREYDQIENKNQLVVVAKPKNILGEWRFLCTKDKEIVAVSSYRYQGLLTRVPSAPRSAIKACEEILEIGYFPDDAFCIDVVVDNSDHGSLGELTSFSSAGLYAMDKTKVVAAIRGLVEKSEKNT